jgi:hypothetical protein
MMELHSEEFQKVYYSLMIIKSRKIEVNKCCSTRQLSEMCKAIRAIGLGCPYGCETSRLPHFPDNQLKDGGKVVSPTRRPPVTLQEDSWYSFLLEAVSIPGP